MSFGDVMSSVLKGVQSGLGVYGEELKKQVTPEQKKREEQMSLIKIALEGLSGKYGDQFGNTIRKMNLDPAQDPSQLLIQIFRGMGSGGNPLNRVTTQVARPVPGSQTITGTSLPRD